MSGSGFWTTPTTSKPRSGVMQTAIMFLFMILVASIPSFIGIAVFCLVVFGSINLGLAATISLVIGFICAIFGISHA